MKIIHSSDWHIGKKLYETKLDKDHDHFFQNLEAIIRAEKAEILIVAGDIFDHAYPSNAALQQYYKTLVRLRETGLKDIIITGGNHDAISTLNAPEDLLTALNINIVAGVSTNSEDQTDYAKEIIKIKDSNNKTQLVICAVPYLREKDIRLSVAGESHTEKSQNIRQGIENHFNTLGNLTKKYRKKGIPVFAIAHLFTAGASTSDSEREIYAGNLLKTQSNIFASNFDYTALGHIHRPQIIDKQENVRYSGAPIPLSFSEREDKKSVVLIEILKNNTLKIKTIPLQPYRKLRRIKGTFEDVKAQIKSIQPNEKVNDLAELLIEEEQKKPELLALAEQLINTTKNIDIIHHKINFTATISGTHQLFDKDISITEINDEDVFLKRLQKENIDNQETLILQYKALKNKVLSEI